MAFDMAGLLGAAAKQSDPVTAIVTVVFSIIALLIVMNILLPKFGDFVTKYSRDRKLGLLFEHLLIVTVVILALRVIIITLTSVAEWKEFTAYLSVFTEPLGIISSIVLFLLVVMSISLWIIISKTMTHYRMN